MIARPNLLLFQHPRKNPPKRRLRLELIPDSLNGRTPVGTLVRPLTHKLQRHPGRRTRIRELHFVGGNGGDDPTQIGCSDEICKRARFDVGVDRLCVFIHRIRPSVGD